MKTKSSVFSCIPVFLLAFFLVLPVHAGEKNSKDQIQNVNVLAKINAQAKNDLLQSLRQQQKIQKALPASPHVLVPEFLALWSNSDKRQELQTWLSTQDVEQQGIAGRVTVQSASPENPVAVFVFDRHGYFSGQAETDETGNYVITGLPAGEYYVVTWSRFYVDELYDNIMTPLTSLETWRQASLVQVTENAITRNIDFDLLPGALLSGQILMPGGAQPVQDERAVIIVTRSESPIPLVERMVYVTDGQYEIRIPYAGSVKVLIDVEGYMPAWYENVTEWTSATPIDIPTLSSNVENIDFTLAIDPEIANQGVISGTIRPSQGLVSPLTIAYAISLEDTSFGGLGLGLFGGYSIDGLPAGDYVVYGQDILGNLTGTGNFMGEFYNNVQDPLLATPVTVRPGQETRDINFTLDPGGSISGQVTDSKGNALDSLLVVAVHSDLGGPGKDPYLTRLQIAAAPTDLQGRYQIQGLPAAEYYVRTVSSFWLDVNALEVRDGKHSGKVVDEFYGDVYNLLEVTSSATVPVTVAEQTGNVDFQLADPGYVNGSVTDAVDGTSVSDLELIAVDAESGYPVLPFGQVNADGSYVLGPLAPGEFKILALTNVTGSDPHLTEFYNGTTSFEDAQNFVVDGNVIGGINFTLEPGASIQGFVDLAQGAQEYLAGRDSLDGFPVFAMNAESGEIVNYDFVQFNGGFRIDHLPAGQYRVMVLPILEPYTATFLGGGQNFSDPNSQIIDLAQGETKEITLELNQASGRLEGSVTHLITGAPLKGIAVMAYDVNGHVKGFDLAGVSLDGSSKDDAGYSIQGLAPGTYYLRTFSLTASMDLIASVLGLAEMVSGDLDILGLIGGGLGNLDLNLDTRVFKDKWYQETDARIQFSMNDLLIKMAAYGTPANVDNFLLPIHLPIPFVTDIPVGAVPVTISADETRSGIDFALADGDIDDLVSTDVLKNDAKNPESFLVEQNYPNPFNPSTTLKITLEKPAHLLVRIYDIKGRLVTTLADGLQNTGTLTLTWNGRDASGQSVAAGVYFALLETPGAARTLKMMLVK
jgi:hypothetical protein